MTWIHLAYMLASVLFIFGLKRMASIRTARQGNLLAITAMGLAILAALIELNLVEGPKFGLAWIFAGVLLGSAAGAVMALRVQMTEMPQMVALLNGMGGLASLLVGLSYYYEYTIQPAIRMTPLQKLGGDGVLSIILSLLIGGITLTGSLIAWAKLQGSLTIGTLKIDLYTYVPEKPAYLPPGRTQLHYQITAALFAGVVLLSFFASVPFSGGLTLFFFVFLLTLVCLALGVMLVFPIGGADMPVVISLLNSYSGIAAAMTGFVIDNNLLIISGSLVGASGIILTQIMCKAMNRSLLNVLFGGFGSGPAATDTKKGGYTKVKSVTAEDFATMLDGVGQVIMIPGYGLAVSQAQQATRELADLLKARGATVKYAIHPVAGRMPGHMNVLLAEASIPYDELYEMDDINNEFQRTDIAVVLGANDVVNPDALDKKDSPLFGMPILNAHLARQVVVIKRSLSPGFAGVPNPLFEADNARMFFDDAKKALEETVKELKNL